MYIWSAHMQVMGPFSWISAPKSLSKAVAHPPTALMSHSSYLHIRSKILDHTGYMNVQEEHANKFNLHQNTKTSSKTPRPCIKIMNNDLKFFFTVPFHFCLLKDNSIVLLLTYHIPERSCLDIVYSSTPLGELYSSLQHVNIDQLCVVWTMYNVYILNVPL